MTTHRIDIEGYVAGELGSLAADDMDLLVRSEEPVAFHAGNGELRVLFCLDEDRLAAAVTEVVGGGEDELKTVLDVVHRYAEREGLTSVAWFVGDACLRGETRLARAAERLGFEGTADAGARLTWNPVGRR